MKVFGRGSVSLIRTPGGWLQTFRLIVMREGFFGLAGGVALALVIWTCFLLRLQTDATALILLVTVVLLSFACDLIASTLCAILAAACFDFFFLEPTFSFKVSNPRDLPAL